MDTTGGMGAPTNDYDVFISYAREDSDRLAALITFLEARKYKVYWDKRLTAGTDWQDSLRAQLRRARKVVALWSTAAAASQIVLWEMSIADGDDKLVPLWLDDTPPGAAFKARHHLKVSDFEAEAEAILAAIAIQGTGEAVTQPPPPDPARIAISNLPTGAGRLIGRDVELSRLATAWASTAPGADPGRKTNLVVLHAIGGAGKTALMRKFLDDLADQGWAGADKVYGWSAYSQGSGEDRNVDADSFLTEALNHFGHDFAREPLGDPLAKGRALAKLVARGRNLLVIDGLEPLQHPPNAITAGDEGKRDVVQRSGAIKDKGVARLIRELAESNRGLVLITSRQEIVELESAHAPRVVNHALEQLDDKAGAELLRSLGVWGAQAELEKAAHSVEGHALSLSLLGTYLSAVHGGDARKRDHFDFEAAVIGAAREGDRKAKRAQHVMEKYVERLSELAGTAGEGAIEVLILRLVGLFDRPAEMEALKAVLAEPAIPGLTEAWHAASAAERWSRWGWALKRLRALMLLNAEDPGAPSALDAHPVVREHFARELEMGAKPAFRAAHGRLYDFYRYRGLPGEFCNDGAYGALAFWSNQADDAKGAVKPILNAIATGQAQADWRALLPPALYAATPDQLQAAAALIDTPAWRAALAAFLPEDEAGMQPCFQAIGHGCAAGRHDESFNEVYWPRVARGNANFAARKLGLYGAELAALASFFEVPFATPSPNLSPARQALVLNLAGFRLRAMGRLAEAVAPTRGAAEAGLQLGDLRNAASGYTTLSELLLTLGRLAEAVAAGADSVTYADRSGDAFWRLASRTTHADALDQAGETGRAAVLLAEAEAMQAKMFGQPPRLYSMQGYRYCDVLLALGRAREVAGRSEEMIQSEEQFSRLTKGIYRLSLGRAHAALAMAAAGARPPVVNTGGATLSVVIPGERSETRDPGATHAAPTAPITSTSSASGSAAPGAPGSRLGATALPRDRLAGMTTEDGRLAGMTSADGGRAALPPTAAHHAALATRHLDDAVARLIKASSDDRTPWGLIARAAFRRWRAAATGDAAALAGADDDLTDAETIARQDERNGGAMRLFLTDIALERCRLALVQAGVALPVPPVVDAPWGQGLPPDAAVQVPPGTAPAAPPSATGTAAPPPPARAPVAAAGEGKGWLTRMLSVLGSGRAPPSVVIPGEHRETRDPGATPATSSPGAPSATPPANGTPAAGGPGSRLAGSQARPLGRDDNTRDATAEPHVPDRAKFLALAGRHWSAAAELVKATGYHRRDGDLAELRGILDREMRA